MALNPEDVAMLDARAREVGEAIGRELRFVEAPNPEFVGLTAANVFVVGPTKLNELTVHDVDITLDELASGSRRLVDDEDGDPRLH